MSITTEKYVRKPFPVEAVRATSHNMNAIAEWTKGEVMIDGSKGVSYVKVEVNRPLSERQTKAFVGDWVLLTNTGFKVYTNKAFNACFEPAGVSVKEKDLEMNGWPGQRPLFALVDEHLSMFPPECSE